MVDVFRKGKFELLTLTETKLKRNGEVSWCRVSDTYVVVQETQRAREGVAVLMTDEWLWMC